MARESKKYRVYLFNEELESLKEVEIVADVRNIGAIGVVELKDASHAQIVQDFCVENGVWIRPFGKLIYSIVSYNITDFELHKITSTMKKAIKSLK